MSVAHRRRQHLAKGRQNLALTLSVELEEENDLHLKCAMSLGMVVGVVE